MNLSFHIEHFAISVANLERSVAWYKKYFGFEEVRRFEKPEFEMKAAILKLEAFVLEIIQPTHPLIKPQEKKTLLAHLQKLGVHHFSLTVNNAAEAFDSLANSNADMVTELMEGRYFFCKDPDGTLIEIKQQK